MNNDRKSPRMSAKESRIFRLPVLKSDYAIVSMPQTAWYWLDDLVRRQFPAGGYKAMVRSLDNTGCADTLSLALRGKAQEYADEKMAELYNLANDNKPANGYDDLKKNASHPASPDHTANMPLAYQLFAFMPHATYLTTVWERRNYHLKVQE